VQKVSGMDFTKETPSVLIADDDDSCREGLRDIVEAEGFRTVLATSGDEAVDMIRKHTIHLALLGLQMPRMTGLEAMELLHQINAALPCILVTANATQEVIRQAFRVRAYSVIPKPVSKNMLLFTMVRAIRSYVETPPQAEE